MSISLIRRLAASATLTALLLAFPGSAGATIVGGCTGEGHATSGNVDLTTESVWHLHRDDVAGGSGTSPAKMTSANVSAYAVGIAIPIAGGTSADGETTGSIDNVFVNTYAALGNRFVVAGSATGDATCNGQIEIVIDDVNVLLTVFGGGGIVLALIGILGVLSFMRAQPRPLGRALSAFLGAIGGLGAALALEQYGVLDPTQPIGLFLVVGLAVVGFATAGLFRPGGPQPMASA